MSQKAQKKEKKEKKDTRKQLSDDVDGFVKDLWGKVVEYAMVGAEEASNVSTTARTRIDIETLKFKRNKLSRTLGEQYYKQWESDSSVAITGTKKMLGQIKKIDKEITNLEAQITKARKKKPTPAKKKAAKLKKPAAARKTAPKRKAASSPSAAKATKKASGTSKSRTSTKLKKKSG
jgi:hypothetical protein